jgi:hypothetical protein
MASALPRESEFVHALCVLTLHPVAAAEPAKFVASLDEQERAELLALADSHHVIIRALEPVMQQALLHGNTELESWCRAAIGKEQDRVANALAHVQAICSELEAARCPATVMKSLDHQPDLGSDIDLYTSADERRVIRVMVNRFNAHLEGRSWGDRLANKWNFKVPGLPESVEVHSGRLGQTGEHRTLAQRFITRRQEKVVDGMKFYVPAPEERIVIATLQRMYRHFYFRICDLVNSAKLVEHGGLDFMELRRASEAAGIWPGVATYVCIVSDKVAQFRGKGLDLPAFVRGAARFGGEKLSVRAQFLRVPIIPEGARLYTKQLTKTALRGDVPAAFRLSLLPPLASAAAVAFRLTGSDKGVW